MVSIREIFQKRSNITAILFTLFLFAISYLRHLIISNWSNLHSNSTYKTENIAWLKAFLIENNLFYDGINKAITNLFFIILFAVFAVLFFKRAKMNLQKKYFIAVHFGLACVAFTAFFIAQSLNFQILDIRSREIIVFLQGPYTFVLIYFTNFISKNHE